MRIVFLGDSITDCGRDRNDENSLGNGFVKVLADKLRPIYPETVLELINKGAAGNEVGDLLAKVDEDAISFSPDMFVVMVGVNDTLHQFKEGKVFDSGMFENNLSELLKKLKSTGATVIFLEPFLMPAPDKTRMRKAFDKELEIIKKVAMDIADEYVAYDEMFNGLAESIPYKEYSVDGVHPTHRGSQLIADNAIKAIRKHLV